LTAVLAATGQTLAVVGAHTLARRDRTAWLGRCGGSGIMSLSTSSLFALSSGERMVSPVVFSAGARETGHDPSPKDVITDCDNGDRGNGCGTSLPEA
jgi:hypothetical protein